VHDKQKEKNRKKKRLKEKDGFKTEETKTILVELVRKM